MLLVAVGLVSCGGGADEESLARCNPAERSVLNAIESGLTVTRGGTLSAGEAVKSNDKDVWFVGAEIDGPGLEEDGDVGVWAVTENPSEEDFAGGIHAVDSTAREFSDWGTAGQPLFTMEDEGAQVAEDCLSG